MAVGQKIGTQNGTLVPGTKDKKKPAVPHTQMARQSSAAARGSLAIEDPPPTLYYLKANQKGTDRI